jgi:hypothetical protein
MGKRENEASGGARARRTAQALHPTTLHVNRALFPNDTVQSRLPEPNWLEHWLDQQIRFDASWEGKVVDRILHNLSLLFGRPALAPLPFLRVERLPRPS